MIDQNNYREAWGRHLAAYQWDYFLTLTSKLPTSGERLMVHFRDKFIRAAARTAQCPLAWFVVAEDGSAGRSHLHALLWTRGRLTETEVAEAWPLGRAEVRPYVANMRAAFYVTKSISAQRDRFDLSRVLPPRLSSPIASEIDGVSEDATGSPGRWPKSEKADIRGALDALNDRGEKRPSLEPRYHPSEHRSAVSVL